MLNRGLQLPAGTVIYFPVEFHETGDVLPHYVVLTSCDGFCYKTFVIKSAPTDWQRTKPEQMANLIKIDCHTHRYLIRDSVVNCTVLRPIKATAVTQHLRENPGDRKTTISVAVRSQIVDAVKASDLLSDDEKEEVVKSLTVG